MTRSDAVSYTFGPDWETPARGEKWYSLLVYLIPESDGTFSAIVAKLPGAASQGDTIEEALKNITEAAAGALLTYREYGEEIPWTAPKSQEHGWLKKFITVKLPAP